MTTDKDAVARARELDRADPLAALVEAFHRPADRQGRPVVYLDGNSLGPQPHAAAGLVERELRRWRSDLIGGWNTRWWGLAGELAAAVETVVGASPGSVLVGDSTSVNLHKLAGAGLDATLPGRDVITHEGQFPTDRYVLEQEAERRGGRLREVPADGLVGAVDDRTALVAVSHVDYRSGAVVDLDAVGRAAHSVGALLLADCSHSAGAVAVDLDRRPVDLAVGCTYKHLHGGPGAPAWLWVAPAVLDSLATPLRGWFGHAEPFALDAAWRPAGGITAFAVGTPPVLSTVAALAGVQLVAGADLDELTRKVAQLGELGVELADAWLAPLGFELASPRSAARRGAHVSFRHDDAWRITQLAADRLGVVVDHRAPDTIRLGLSPLPLRYADVVEGLRRIRDGVHLGWQENYAAERPAVT